MRRFSLLLAALLAPLLAGRASAEPPRMAVFDFSLIDTSPAAPSEAELARLHRLNDALRTALSGRFAVVDAASLQSRLAVTSIRGCNGCELDLARQLGAEQLAYGWVQKVSNLILNINLVVEDVATGRPLRAESVDIRGNTDESRDPRPALSAERAYVPRPMKISRRAAVQAPYCGAWCTPAPASEWPGLTVLCVPPRWPRFSAVIGTPPPLRTAPV